MSNTTTSPNMSLIVPTVSVDPGPDWANNVNACLSILDQHNHSSGSGVQISQAGISLTAGGSPYDSLSFNTTNAYSLRSVRFVNNGSPLGLGTDIGCLYEAGGELYYNDASSNQVKITSGGSVNGSSGTITGLPSGTASASYSAGTFIFQSATSTAANVDCESILLRNSAANSKALTINPPNSMAANYALTMPSIPAGTSFVTIDTSGNVSGSILTTAGLTTSNLSASAGIVGTQIANATIATANMANGSVTAAILSTATHGTVSQAGGGSYTTGSYGTYSSMSVTITASGNRPIMVSLHANTTEASFGAMIQCINGGGSTSGYVKINSSNTGALAIYSLNAFSSGATQVGQLTGGVVLDYPSAGSVTYTLQFKLASGPGYLVGNNMQMDVVEL